MPEVPLEARQKLLALGTAHGFLRVASFTSAEIVEVARPADEIDLLAVNLDEAAALAGVSRRKREPEPVVRAALAKLSRGQVAYRDRGRARELVLGWDGAAHLPVVPVVGHRRRGGCASGGDPGRAGRRVATA